MTDNKFLTMLSQTNIYPIINKIEETYTLLKKYPEYNDSDFVCCINEYVDDLRSEEAGNVIRGRTWDYFFSDDELLKEMLIFYMNIDSYDWIYLFKKYTDYSTSEIYEFIISHCEMFELGVESFLEYL